MAKPKIAQHVKLGDHELVVDGEDFPWFVAPNIKVTETGYPDPRHLVHIEILPIRCGTGEVLTITCPGRPMGYVSIGESVFPWLFSQDGYRVISSRGGPPRLRLALYAAEIEDVRS